MKCFQADEDDNLQEGGSDHYSFPEVRVASFERTVKSLQDKIDDLENTSPRNNLMIMVVNSELALMKMSVKHLKSFMMLSLPTCFQINWVIPSAVQKEYIIS